MAKFSFLYHRNALKEFFSDEVSLFFVLINLEHKCFFCNCFYILCMWRRLHILIYILQVATVFSKTDMRILLQLWSWCLERVRFYSFWINRTFLTPWYVEGKIILLVDYVLIRETTDQRKHVLWHIFLIGFALSPCNLCKKN